ncbi:hypothetical protein JY651_10760 [Pyxidicoccus parkwayensis]|uniref:AsmA-like C-terminal domain-containing protein n=1 Tax=Pyxidicoccus parkwayensis TaxID=2813578 RepID=A0ABX7P4F2_9BACT|nr:hypothetical protein [Pyxidicoccus parkwaysis]QSQ25369.1 hypothetical protein JY651_10760 [Pyxidicoccus parkwaysis]
MAWTTPSTPRARWRRVLVWTLGLVLALEALLNIVINTPLVPWFVHRITPRTTLGWNRAWWPWPGRAHARGAFMEQRTAHVRWRVEADEVEAELSLPALIRRHVEAEAARARGARAWVEPLPPEERTAPLPPKLHPWHVDLRDLEVEDVRELTAGPAHYVGPASARGKLRIIARERFTVDAAHLELAGGFVEVDGKRAARMEVMSADFSLDATRVPAGGWDILGSLGGRLHAKAELLPLEWLGSRLPEHSQVSVHDGAGTLEADVRFQQGLLEPGSRVEARGAPLRVRFGPAQARASWHLLGTVEAGNASEPRGRLRLSLTSIRLEGEKTQVLELPEVTLIFHAEPRLGAPVLTEHHELHVTSGKPMDLRLLNAWTGETFQVTSGNVTLKASGHGGSSRAHEALSLTLDTDLVEARAGGTRLLGRASAVLDTRKLSLLRGKALGLDGTTLHLSQVSADLHNETVREWSGTFSLPHATLTLSPPELEARFSARFATADPFVAILTSRKKLPHFLAPLLHARDLEVTGHVRLGDAGIRVRELHITDENLHIEGRMDLSRGITHALILATLHGVSGAMEVTPEHTHFQLDDARQWYEEHLALPP